MPKPESAPWACTLDMQDMAARLAQIQQLTCEHLRSHSLDGRTLRLTYDVLAADRVARIVDLERVCCAFLDFELNASQHRVELTIRAPEQEGIDGTWLFGQFLPGPGLPQATARETSSCTCCRG
jgi:hypothetical protein